LWPEQTAVGSVHFRAVTVAGTFSRVLFFRDRIEIISPNKPNSSQQKYRLTAQGKAVVQAQQNEGNS
jgi:hypothetical protein|tara:strand:+ start:804 stop:1004 length:201 start_codon:yes stop_codon:yes gene_type:complete